MSNNFVPQRYIIKPSNRNKEEYIEFSTTENGDIAVIDSKDMTVDKLNRVWPQQKHNHEPI